MNVFCIKGDYVDADFSSRHNLFALSSSGQSVVNRVIDRRIASKGYIFPDRPAALWTEAEIATYNAARLSANDGRAAPFDFIECFKQVAIAITVDLGAKTFKVYGASETSFAGNICNILIANNGQVIVHSVAKMPGQSAAEVPLGTYLAAQIFYDSSDDELYVVTWRRFQYQTVFTPSVTFSNQANVLTRELSVDQSSGVQPLVERLFSKRWAVARSSEYTTSIVQTRGLLDSPWVVLEHATFLQVPKKPTVVKFFLSRFFEKFDYPFKLSDFSITHTIGAIAIAESPDGAMAVTVTGSGVLEVVPSESSRIFLGEDVIRTSDLHLRLMVV